MLKGDEIQSGNPAGKGFSRVNRNILIFIFFVMLSFVLWYLNSLSKVISTDLKYPVEYRNIPEGKIAEGELPSKLNIMLNGQGYSILRQKLSASRHPVVIDFSEISYNHFQNDEADKCYIITAPLLTSFNEHITTGCRITSVKPDTIIFSMK